jgi:hypothetical protein
MSIKITIEYDLSPKQEFLEDKWWWLKNIKSKEKLRYQTISGDEAHIEPWNYYESGNFKQNMKNALETEKRSVWTFGKIQNP